MKTLGPPSPQLAPNLALLGGAASPPLPNPVASGPREPEFGLSGFLPTLCSQVPPPHWRARCVRRRLRRAQPHVPESRTVPRSCTVQVLYVPASRVWRTGVGSPPADRNGQRVGRGRRLVDRTAAGSRPRASSGPGKNLQPVFQRMFCDRWLE